MRDVTLTYNKGTDNCGGAVSCVVTSITSNEPVNGTGDGDTAPDATLTSPPSNSAKVRAERSGHGDGRVYRLHVTGTDTHGATCEATVIVGVPHDQGTGSTPVDSAPPSFDSLTP